ncbi:MAG: carboxypeptidase-like regulatory domain-containing protein [bacterium]
MKRKALLLAFLGVVLISCNPNEPIIDVAWFITGTVSDSMTGMAIELASVWLGDSAHLDPMASDSVGNYLWEGLGEKPARITCWKIGYHSQEKPVPVGGSTVRVDFRLIPIDSTH